MNGVRRELECPVCGRSFTVSLLVNYDIGGKDSDQCPRYLGGNPMPRFLHVCPGCGYVGFEADYAPIPDPALRDDLRKTLGAFPHHPDVPLNGPERFRRAAVLAARLGRPHAEIAELYLQATWCSRLEGEPDAVERRARKKAVEYFERARELGEIQDDDLAALCYLLGELKRRLGRAEDARREFARMDDYGPLNEPLLSMREKQLAAIEAGHVGDDIPGVKGL